MAYFICYAYLHSYTGIKPKLVFTTFRVPESISLMLSRMPSWLWTSGIDSNTLSLHQKENLSLISKIAQCTCNFNRAFDV